MGSAIFKDLRKIGRSGLLPAGAIVIGGGSHMSMIEGVAKNMLKFPVKIGFMDIPGSKGVLKDQRLLVAYGVATDTTEQNHTKSIRRSSTDGDGFLAAIKDFFRQLMP